MVYIAKMLKNNDWKTLSIARNTSEDFNQKMLENSENENSSPVCYAKSSDIRDEFK